MAKRFIGCLLLSYTFAFSSLAMKESDIDLERAGDNFKEAASLCTFPLTRGNIEGLCHSSGGGYLGDMRGLHVMLLPGTLVLDGFCMVVGAVATPIAGGAFVYQAIKKGIGKIFKKNNPNEVVKNALSGYLVRLKTIKTFIKNEHISPNQLLTLLLLGTAWDSKDSFKTEIILGNGFKVTKEMIKNTKFDLQEKALVLFDKIAEASQKIADLKLISFEETMKELAKITLKSEKVSQEIASLHQILSDAGRIASELKSVSEKNNN